MVILQAAEKTPPQTSQNLWEGIQHRQTIERLIQCESSGRNISIIDSNGLPSRGILQFQDSTWEEFAKKAGVTGSPMEPRKAILVADYMIESGYLGRWSCARILGLL